MVFRKKNNQKVMRASTEAAYGYGASVTPTSPPLSQAQEAQYAAELARINRPVGAAVGCAYTGFEYGIQCNFAGGMPAYAPRVESYASHWEGNVAGGWPMPAIETPGGYAQIMLGGGAGSPECAVDCACEGDPTCPCRGANNLNCGYTAVNQTCVEPIPDGQYKSLAACEAVHARGHHA